MNYKLKYNIYKKKYLNLKYQYGGNGIFCIYTTGICDTGANLEKLFKYWQEFLCHRVCSMIPSRFTNIEIIHSDILYQYPGPYQIKINDKKVIEEINERLKNDFKIDSRISKNIFQREELNFNEISKSNSYIIIDFAHIFYYTGIPITITPLGSSNVFIGGHYGEHTGQPINLNIIYLGYIGEQQYDFDTKANNRLICECEFFKINDDNTITTIYTELINENRFPKLKGYELESPLSRITNIIKANRIKIGKIFRIKYGNYDLFDEYFSSPKFLYSSQNDIIYKFIIKSIMNDINTETEIICLIDEKIYNDFIL